MKNSTFILIILLSISKMKIYSQNEQKNTYNLTVLGFYSRDILHSNPTESPQLILLGFNLEKAKVNPRITQVYSFYNSYYNKFNEEINYATRFSSLTYGWNYNLLKKPKLNLGIQQGLFLYDRYYDDYNYHSFGLAITPQIEYRYCFNKIGLGLNVMLPTLLGRYHKPSGIYTTGLNPTEIYETGYGLNGFLLLNLTLSIKL